MAVKPTMQTGFANNMSFLLNRLERNLGVKALQLGEDYGKPAWQKIIVEDALLDFSRFYGKKMQYCLYPKLNRNNNGIFYIDEAFIDNNIIVGVQDINWIALSERLGALADPYGCGGYYDPYDQCTGFSFEAILQQQVQSDLASIVNTTTGLTFEAPNILKINGIGCIRMINCLDQVPITVLVKHDPSLVTIEQGKMLMFERMCTIYVASFLVNELKYMEPNNVVYATLNLHLDDLRRFAEQKESIIQELQEKFVSADNTSIPLIMSF